MSRQVSNFIYIKYGIIRFPIGSRPQFGLFRKQIDNKRPKAIIMSLNVFDLFDHHQSEII